MHEHDIFIHLQSGTIRQPSWAPNFCVEATGSIAHDFLSPIVLCAASGIVTRGTPTGSNSIDSGALRGMGLVYAETACLYSRRSHGLFVPRSLTYHTFDGPPPSSPSSGEQSVTPVDSQRTNFPILGNYQHRSSGVFQIEK